MTQPQFAYYSPHKVFSDLKVCGKLKNLPTVKDMNPVIIAGFSRNQVPLFLSKPANRTSSRRPKFDSQRVCRVVTFIIKAAQIHLSDY